MPSMASSSACRVPYQIMLHDRSAQAGTLSWPSSQVSGSRKQWSGVDKEAHIALLVRAVAARPNNPTITNVDTPAGAWRAVAHTPPSKRRLVGHSVLTALTQWGSPDARAHTEPAHRTVAWRHAGARCHIGRACGMWLRGLPVSKRRASFLHAHPAPPP
jgi:hypothetical protein